MTKNEAINILEERYIHNPTGEDDEEYGHDIGFVAGLHTAKTFIRSLPSADAVSQSEQYKKGFEDAKRAFELEFAREAESIRKRNAQLEVMLNVQKALLAEAEWIPCSERLPNEDECGWYLVTVKGHELFVDVAPFNDELWKGLASHQKVIAWQPLPKPYREDGE